MNQTGDIPDDDHNGKHYDLKAMWFTEKITSSQTRNVRNPAKENYADKGTIFSV